MTCKKYVVKYQYHQPELVEIEVEKETDKTITISEYKNIFGNIYYLPNRLLKSNYIIFDTKKEAIDWLVLQAKEDVMFLNGVIKEVENSILEMVKENDLAYLR